MKCRQFVVAAALFSAGWSSQVAYQNYMARVEMRAHISRNIASEENVVISMDNIEIEAKDISILAKEIKRTKEDIIIELRELSTATLEANKVREDHSKEMKNKVESLRLRLQEAETVLAKNNIEHKPEEIHRESDDVDPPKHEPKDKEGIPNLKEIEDSIAQSRKIVDEFNIVDFEKSFDEALGIVMQERTMTDQDRIVSLESKICSQNAKIETLTDKLEELLKDKEKVVKEMDDEDKDKKDKKGKKDKKDKNDDQDAMRQMMAQMFGGGMFMGPAQFFSGGMFQQPQVQSQGPDYSFLSNSSQMGGMDMNFLMLTSLLGQNTGMGSIGGRTNINYSPIYNNNQNYSVPSAFVNSGSGNFGFPMGGQAQQMQGQGQQAQMFQSPFALTNDGNVGQMMPSFPRSNALGTNNTSTHQAMGGIAPNAGKM